MFGDFFQRLGNFFTGSGWVNDDEERRKKAAEAARPKPAPAPVKIAAPQNFATVQQPQSLVNQNSPMGMPQLGGVNQNPDVSRAQQILREGGSAAPFKPEIIQEARRQNEIQDEVKKPSMGNLNLPGQRYNPQLDLRMNKPALKPYDKYAGLSDEDRGIAKSLDDKGKDTTKFIAAARDSAKAQQQAEYDNSIQGKIFNFFGEAGKAVISPVVGLGEGLGTALASNSQAVRDADAAVEQGRQQDLQMIQQLGQRLKDPNLDPATRSRIAILRNKLLTEGPSQAEQSQAQLYADMAQKTDPTTTIINAVGTAAMPLVGGLSGGAITAAPKVATGINAVIDPLSLLEKIPKTNAFGRLLNTEITGIGRNSAIRAAENEAGREGATLAGEVVKEGADDLRPGVRPEETPTVVRDPNSPITQSPTTMKPPAITSPNRPPTVQQPGRLTMPETVGSEAPTIQQGVQMPEPAQMPKVEIPTKTADEAVAEAQKAIDEAATKAPELPAATQAVDTKTPDQLATEAAAAKTPVSTEAVADAAEAAANKAPTDAIADELGTIARKTVAAGKLNSDADAQILSSQVGDAIEAAAKRTGSTWEEINKKIQAAWSQGMKDYKEAGLTKEQFDVARKAADELSMLRQRVDPSLLKEGEVGQFYSPRQAKDTEFTQELVNEISRGKQGAGLRDSELDLSTTPYRQAIRRYSNAPEAMGDQLIDSIESKVVKDALGNERVVETGVKVPEEAKAAFKESLKPYIKAQDDAIRAADAGDAKGIDAAIRAGDKAIDDALAEMAAKLPKDTVEARNAIGSLIAERKAYMQSTARTNMFTNVVNRMFDQAQKGIVNFGDKALPLVNKISAKMTGKSDQPGIATDRLSRSLAKKYSKGTLRNQLNRNFMTNVRLAGAGARNPATKALAKADAAYRSAGTYLTSLGDMSTNAVKATNLVMLGKARAAGITDKAELEAYLVKNLQSPEYLDIYRNMSNQYAGYIGMPQTLTSTGMKGGKTSEFFSKIDNAVKNGLDKTRLPDRVKQELNDVIMPAIAGFAGATSRVAAKQLNALALGIPNVMRGLRLAASDSPNSRAIGEMMISRSIIDGTMAGGVMAGGAMLGATGHWTGAYPSDPNERARWEKEGIQPNSFSFDVDGKTVYIQPGRILGVLALPMVLPAVVADSANNGGDAGEAVGEILNGTVGQFNENLGADAIIQHIGDLDKLINGNDSDKKAAQKSLMNMLGYSISNLNPAAGLQNNIAAASDPYKRDTSGGIIDVVANRNPVTRQSLPVKEDNLGNPVKNNSQLSLGSNAITVGDGQGGTDGGADPVSAEINRLAQAKFEVMPARDVKNTNSQDDAKVLMDSDLYRKANDETKADMLHKVLLGTDTKDISTSLDPKQRSALIQHKLLDENKREVWLENNDNAYDYYTGLMANGEANGTLSSKDKDMGKTGSLAQKAAIATVNRDNDVPQKLILNYADTTKTEFNRLPDDSDLKKALVAYDQMLEKAGLPSKYKNKYGKYGSAGGGGGKGSDKFAFASLPSSLVGVGSTGSTSGGYAKEAPTFTPIADLKAPTGAAIPKGRSISVKKGIQI